MADGIAMSPSHDSSHQPTNYLSYLSSDSYTLHWLQHATPEHLYLTTRRSFIGPIPEGWLKSHRRDWYRNQLHLGSSARTLSFSAEPDTGSHQSGASHDHPQHLNTEPTNVPSVGGERTEARQDLSEDFEDEQALSQSRLGNEATSSSAYGPQTEYSDSSFTNQHDSNATGSESYGSTSVRLATPAQALPISERPKQVRRVSDTSYFTAAETSVSNQQHETNKQSNERSGGSQVVVNNGARPDDPIGNKSQESQEALITGGIQQSSSPHRSQPPTQSFKGSSSETKRGSTAIDTNAPNERQTRNASMPSSATAAVIHGNAQRTGLVKFNLPAGNDGNEETVDLRLAQYRRRQTFKRLRGATAPKGDVIRTEKMLVRIDSTSHELAPDFDEKYCPKIEARTIEKWREFMVVCREPNETTSTAGDYTLQLYKTRVIPATAKSHVRRRPTHEIALDSKKVRINIFSPLDKTITLWEPAKHGSRIYIMRPRSAAVSMQWFTFLRSLLGRERSTILQINVPDLSATLRLDHPFEILESSEYLSKAAGGNKDAISRIAQEEQAVAPNLVSRCVEMLERSPEWGSVIDEWVLPSNVQTGSDRISTKNITAVKRDHESGTQTTSNSTSEVSKVQKQSMLSMYAGHVPVGLAWKRYDRLEWVAGENEKSMYGTIGMESSHELELRPKMHYPTSVLTRKGNRMTEPPAVEGFLIRLTSQKGSVQKLRKMYHKRLYFSTHDQFLIFNRPANAKPPAPPRDIKHSNSSIPTTAQIVEQTPMVYAVTPYALKHGQIEWLSNESAATRSEVAAFDETAFLENQRKINVLLRCDGFIDLLSVAQIRHVQRGAAPADDSIEENSEVNFSSEVDDSQLNDGEAHGMDDSRTFELKLINGLVVRLQAYNKATKVEWMRHLHSLVKYWSQRASADLAILKSVRRQNLEALNIDERLEAYVGQFAHKWEVNQSYASPELYNMCGITCCRAITHSGTLYRKPRMHATFRSCHVLLVHGHLLVFQDSVRSRKGNIIKHVHNERMTAIDLSDCYIYSGLIASNDLLYSGKAGYEKSQPGQRGGLPRMFADGWTSQDDETSLTFVLWSGKRKSWFRSEQASNSKDGFRSKMKLVSQLGKEGKSVVFKARSRVERERWVQAISIEIERLGQKEDVRIVEKT